MPIPIAEKQFYTTQEVIKLLGVSEGRLIYRIRTGEIPEPKVKMSNFRYFDDQEVMKIKAHFENHKPWERLNKEND